MFLFLFYIVIFPFFFVRWLRWLAVVQQKEYRIDRLNSFLKSAEGQRDFFSLIPAKNSFTKKGLKRPVRTVRVLIVGLISIGLTSIVLGVSSMFGFVTAGVMLLLLYVFIPFLLILSCVPTAVVSAFVTLYFLFKAQQKIKKGNPKIIGVGGSYGKTSTKHLLAHVLSQKYRVFVTPKSHNTKYSIARSIFYLYSDQEIALLEYGAYTIGEIQYLTRWFKPDLAIETGFTLQHLSIFGSVENSLMAESELVAALPEKAKVFCNGSDAGAVKICELGRQKNQAQVVYYSGPQSALALSDITINQMGEVSFIWNKEKIETKMVGAHYLPNIQAVVLLAQELGLQKEDIVKGLQSFVPSASFVRSFLFPSGATMVDDGGTSNPEGFSAAIQLAKAINKKQKILVASDIVDLGEKSTEVHQKLAEEASQVFQKVLYVGSDGKAEFQKKFGENYSDEQEKMLEVLEKMDRNSLLVIEGRIPKWLDLKIKKYANL